MKAEKEPRKAIIELNSGTRIETRIESNMTRILWKPTGLNSFFSQIGGLFVVGDSSAVVGGVLLPRSIAIVEFNFTRKSETLI
jgi:hypothetical protein